MATALSESLQRIIWTDPGGQNGEPCFYGTRVPVKTLFDYLKGGHTLKDFVEGFPPVTREQAEIVLDASQDSLYDAPAELLKGWGETLVKLHQFTKLESDWDAYGAAPLAQTALIAAQQLIAEAMLHFPHSHSVPYDLGPLPNGGVQIVWTTPRAEMEVDISAEGRYGYLLIQPPGDNPTYTPTYTEDNDLPLDTLLALLAQVLRASAASPVEKTA